MKAEQKGLVREGKGAVGNEVEEERLGRAHEGRGRGTDWEWEIDADSVGEDNLVVGVGNFVDNVVVDVVVVGKGVWVGMLQEEEGEEVGS